MDANIDESDFYRLINVSRTASPDEIKKAFRKRALELHPDKNPGSDEMMKRLNMAKDTLLDPDKRQKHDDEHDEEHEDGRRAQDINASLQCGKRLSRRYEKMLAKYIADFDKLNIKDNFNVVSDILANLNDKLSELINISTTTASEDTSSSSQAKDTEELRNYFYKGQYISMARYLIHNHRNSSSISTLYKDLTTGRDVSGTPPSFQAGLLLLQGQLSANKKKHGESLKAFQEAVFTFSSDEMISATNILIGDTHLIAATRDIIHQLKGNVDITQAHKYRDRLKRTNHLRLIYKYEKDVLQNRQTSDWDKAMMYINLTMATSGIAGIHCFLVAMTYLLKEITKNEGEEVARAYAICNIICELAIRVVCLARKCALPITEMHFNKLSFIISRKAHEILKSKLKNYKISFWRRVFGHRRAETTIITETHIEMYKMMTNSIHRLIRVSPFVDLNLTLVADMIYLDLISDKFVEEFYKSRADKNESYDKESWSHLYNYYLLECMWKTGNDSKLDTYREKSMNSLLEKNGWYPEDVEETMSWDVINRDTDGWLDIKKPWLSLGENNYDSVDGVEIDVEMGTFRVLYTPSPPQSSGLFDDLDIMEVFHNGLQYSVFTLEPPDNDLQYHPFHQLKFSPPSLKHATNILQTLLHADYILKMMSMGVEVSANAPHLFRSASEDGFLGLLPAELREKVKPLSERRGGNSKENVHRFWIESGDLECSRADINDGKTWRFIFGPCQMHVKTHLMKHNSDGELVDDSEEDESDGDEEDVGNKKKPKKKRITAETEFANDFTECYDEVGNYFPILLRLRELMKLQSVFRILNNIFDSLETAKKELRMNLTTRYKEIFGDMRKKIPYPQNNSSNVNRIYRGILRDQGINESNLADGEEARAKSEIRHQLDEADAQIVVNLTETLASQLEIRKCSQLTTKVRKWLNDGVLTSYTRELVAYVVEQVYPREFDKLDRFAKNAASKGMRFCREDEKNSGLTTTDGCPWVPAAFCRGDYRRVYGGVCLYPNLKNVTRVTRQKSNNQFKRNHDAGSVIKLTSVVSRNGAQFRYGISC